MSAADTATPWEAKRVEQAGNGEWLWCVYDGTGMVVAKRLSQAKAEHIVRACNEFDARGTALQVMTAKAERLESLNAELVRRANALCHWVEGIPEECGIGTIRYGHLMREAQELRDAIEKAGAQ